MSKNKPKDKKNDASSALEKQFQSQKRELIDLQFTLKKVQQKLSEKTIENETLTTELEQVRLLNQDKIRTLLNRTEDDEKRLNAQINRITELEICATRYESQITSLKEELSNEKTQRIKDAGDIRSKMESEKQKQDIKIRDLEIYAENREKNEQEMLDLKQRIQHEKSEKVRELADKEREKVQATDKLRDQMDKKIRQMRSNLLSLKKEQLSTTTRLTILQNHQLTSQLEYQSKQTEKLIFKEEDMSSQIKKLTQQVMIHRQVEEQLAKRSHFSKGVIKKLNDRVAQLEEELKQAREHAKMSKNSQHSSEIRSKAFLEQEESKMENREITAEIQRQLEATEKKYMELESKFDAQRKEKESIASQLKKFEDASNELVKMLIIYSEEILSQKNLKIDEEGTGKENENAVLSVNLSELRQKNVQEWSRDEVSLVTKILINSIRPYLTKKNVMVPAIRRLLVIEDSKNENANHSASKLPKLLGEIDENAFKGLKSLPINVASKIVGSNLREWGSTVRMNPSQRGTSLKRKYKLSQSHR